MSKFFITTNWIVFLLLMHLNTTAAFLDIQSVSPSSICQGGNFTVTFEDDGNNHNYSIGYFANSVFIVINSVTNTTTSQITCNNTTGLLGSYTLYVRLNNGILFSTQTGTITVNADPTITTQPSNPPAVCAGGSANFNIVATGGTPSLNYQWQYNNSGTWADVVDNTPLGAIYSNQTSNAFTVTGISSAGSYQYRCAVSAAGSGCDGINSNSGTLTVVADPSITIQPSNPTTICAGGSVSFGIVATGGTPSLSYQWQYNNGGTYANVAYGTPAGASYSNQTTNTITVSGISGAGSYQFRCAVSATGSGCDPINSSPGTLTVVADPSITTQPVNPSAICAGGSAVFNVTATNGTPSLNYQWQYNNGGTWANVANSTPSGAIYSNQTTNALSVSGISGAGNYQYRCAVSSTGNGCDVINSSSGTLTVVADPSIAQPSNPAPICTGGSATVSVTASGGTPSLSYQWQYSANGVNWNNVVNNTPSDAGYSNQTTSNLTVSGISNIGTYLYRCAVSASGSGCDPVNSSSVTITVVDQAVAATPAIINNTICFGGNAVITETPTGFGTGTLSYQWQYNNSGSWVNVATNTPLGAAYTDQTTNSLTVSGFSIAGSPQYRCVVTPSGNGCVPKFTTAAQITVKADPVITTTGFSSATICTGGSNTDTVAVSGGDGTTSYQWQYNNVGTWVNVTNGTPAGANYIAPIGTTNHLSVSGISNSGNLQYRVVVTQTTSGCGNTSSLDAFNVVDGPSLSTPSFTPICQGGSSNSGTLTVNGGNGSNTFQWQYYNGSQWQNVSNNTPAGTSYTGQTTNSLSVTGIIDPGSYQYRCSLTQSGSSCTANSPVGILVVHPDPAIGQQPQMPASICNGGLSNLSVMATGGYPSLAYQWEYSSNGSNWASVSNGTPSGSTYANQTTNSMTVSGISNPNNYLYRCSISASGSGCNAILSNLDTVRVVPDPSISQQPVNPAAICVGGTANLSVSATNGTPSLDYQWQYNNAGTWSNVTNGAPVGANYSGNTTTALTVEGISASGNYQYRCNVSAGGSGCDGLSSSAATVSVVADPAFGPNQQLVNDTICAGGSASINVTTTGGTPALQCQWQYSPTGSNWVAVTNNTPAGAVYSGQTGLNFIVNGISAVGSYEYRCRIFATGSGCDNNFSDSSFVHVVSDPSVIINPNSPDICAGQSDSIKFTATGGTPSLSYNWQFSADGVNWNNVANSTPVSTTYSGPLTSTLIFSTGNNILPATYFYRCQILAAGSGCTDTAAYSQLLIHKLPPIPTFVSDPSPVCAGTTGISMRINNDTVYNNYSDYSYVWNSVPTGLPSTGLSLAYPTFDFPKDTTYTISLVITDANNCVNRSQKDFNVTGVALKDTIVMQQTGGVQTLILTDNTVASYQWGYDDVATLEPHYITGETFQSFNNGGLLDITQKYYWVQICKGGCCNKIYYNRGSLSVTAIRDLNSDDVLKFYPNPTTGLLNLETKNGLSLESVSLYDITGQLVRIYRLVNTTQAAMDVSNLESGVYVAEVFFNNKTTARLKIIKEK